MTSSQLLHNVINNSNCLVGRAVYAFVSGAGGLRFKSWAGQIVYSVANDSPLLQHFFEWSCVAHRRNDAEMGPANSFHASA